jgi:PEP-CTERM motif-containing protein
MMKSVKIAIVAVALLFGAAKTASATTIWFLNNVNLQKCDYLGQNCVTNTATGQFTVNTAVTAVTAWSITVTGTNLAANDFFTNGPAGQLISFAAAAHVDFYNGNTSRYLNLEFTAGPITDAGGTIALTLPTMACPGCTLMTSGSISTTQVTGLVAAVPEPATLGLMALGLLGVAVKLRARRA